MVYFVSLTYRGAYSNLLNRRCYDPGGQSRRQETFLEKCD